jgi:broad specificity phosphatase PhoE
VTRYGLAVRLLLLVRHGQSVFNVDGVVNGDPSLDRGLSERGETEAGTLARQLAGVEIDLCVTSRFPRAQQTARLALGARADSVRHDVDSDLDDIRIGELEGRTLDAYRAWKHEHAHSDPFPGGESLDDAARRYADAYERLLQHDASVILCVCHEIPVRYAVNAAAGSSDLDAPVHDIANATPYLFEPDVLAAVVAHLRDVARDGRPSG